MNRDRHVAVVGGGPAGAAAAITLARLGLRVTVFEAASGPQAKPGETLVPQSAGLLEMLGFEERLRDGPHFRAYGNRSWWGGNTATERNFIGSPHGSAWRIDRRAFEETGMRLAVEAGAEWRYGCRVRGVVEADFTIDATGRSAVVARRMGARRVGEDALVGAGAELTPAAGGSMRDTFTMVEAVRNGWWYLALLPCGKLSVFCFTDFDLPQFRVAKKVDGWWGMLQETKHIGRQVRACGAAPPSRLQIAMAASSHLSQIAGEKWLAAGDAAAAHDPLSSHGITSALGTGYYAARAAAALLDGQREALPAYLQINQSAWNSYCSERARAYAGETRWRGEEFWRRRLSRPDLRESA